MIFKLEFNFGLLRKLFICCPMWYFMISNVKSTKELLTRLDSEKIYTHVLNLHYERSPVFSMDNLTKAQQYIEDQFIT